MSNEIGQRMSKHSSPSGVVLEAQSLGQISIELERQLNEKIAEMVAIYGYIPSLSDSSWPCWSLSQHWRLTGGVITFSLRKTINSIS